MPTLLISRPWTCILASPRPNRPPCICSMELDSVRSAAGGEHERIAELRAAVSSSREELEAIRSSKEEACSRAAAAQQQLRERSTEAAQLQRQLAEAREAAGSASDSTLDGLRRQIAELKEVRRQARCCLLDAWVQQKQWLERSWSVHGCAAHICEAMHTMLLC